MSAELVVCCGIWSTSLRISDMLVGHVIHNALRVYLRGSDAPQGVWRSHCYNRYTKSTALLPRFGRPILHTFSTAANKYAASAETLLVGDLGDQEL